VSVLQKTSFYFSKYFLQFALSSRVSNDFLHLKVEQKLLQKIRVLNKFILIRMVFCCWFYFALCSVQWAISIIYDLARINFQANFSHEQSLLCRAATLPPLQ